MTRMSASAIAADLPGSQRGPKKYFHVPSGRQSVTP